MESDDNGDFLDSQTSDYQDIIGAEMVYEKVFAKGYGGGDESALVLSLAYSEGKSAYDGHLQSGGVIISPYSTTTDMKIFTPKLRWMETKKTKNYDVGVFVSLGYRYWERDNSNDQYGYLEEYKWAYADIGLKALFHDENWHIGLELAYQKAIAPTLYAGVDGGVDFDLGDTSGYNVVVPLQYDINKNLAFEMAYEYDMWKIEKSNVVNGYYEPQSETKNETIKVGLILKW